MNEKRVNNEETMKADIKSLKVLLIADAIAVGVGLVIILCTTLVLKRPDTSQQLAAACNKLRLVSGMIGLIAILSSIMGGLTLLGTTFRYKQFLLEKEAKEKAEALKTEQAVAEAKAKMQELEKEVMGTETPADPPFVKEIKHLSLGAWHQYDILIDARIYGWDAMIDWAEYMVANDLDMISEVTVSAMGQEDRNITEEYRQAGSFRTMETLKEEFNCLSVAGMSKGVGGPLKIVWFNQSRMLRFFTIANDEARMRNYAETMIRRKF